MTPSPLIHDCPRTNRCRSRSTGNARTRAKSPILPTLDAQTLLQNATPDPRSPYSSADQSSQPLQSKLFNLVAAAKFP